MPTAARRWRTISHSNAPPVSSSGGSEAMFSHDQPLVVTSAPDDIDWADETRLAIEERVAMSPDALTGMEANLRFNGPENMFTRVFGRLTAWQNWIFQRPNATGPEGALKLYGTGKQSKYDRKRA